LVQAIKADSQRAKQNRRSAKSLLEQIKIEGYYSGCAVSSPFYPCMAGCGLTGAKKLCRSAAFTYAYGMAIA
jgi:hypothetical protein